MSLSDENRTVLKLVLSRGKTYAEIAALLGTGEADARARAHAALDAVSGAGLDPEISDYLLGQGDELSHAAARRRIERDPELADRVEETSEQLTLVAPTGGGRPAPAPDGSARTPRRAPAPASPPAPATGSGPGEPAATAPPRAAWTGQLTAAQRRLVAVLLGAALLAAILILILTGVIGGSGGDGNGSSGDPAPTTATLQSVAGESGEGTVQVGFNAQGQLAANLQISDLRLNRGNETYALWLYGSKGAFPINQSRVDRSGTIAGQVPLNEAVICLIAADVFPELRLSRVSRVQMDRALRQARKANGGSGRIPDYVGTTVLTGRISMPQEAKDRIVPGCTGAAAQAEAG